MAFTDVEMAILSQMSYKVTKKIENQSLYDVLTDSAMKSYLKESLGSEYDKESLGSEYDKALDSLISKAQKGDYQIVKAHGNTEAGFSAFAVKDPDNNVTVACRGTEMGRILKAPGVTLNDLAEDVSLTFKKQTDQQADMETFMKGLQKKGDFESYSFTGHSLGGNLAMYGAITMDDPSKVGVCKTFNAPGFNEQFRKEHKKAIKALEKNEKIISYQNQYDGVSEAMTVPGKVVILKSKDKSRWGLSGHSLNDLDVSGKGFKKAKKQKKKTTALGIALGFASEIPDAAHDVVHNMPQIAGPVLPSFGFGKRSIGVAASGGSKKIQLTPAELKGMSAQMLSLSNEYDGLFDNVVSDLNRVNGNWSANLANNFSGKITSAQGRFQQLPDMLASGAAAAELAAVSYESTDSTLAKSMSAEQYQQV